MQSVPVKLNDLKCGDEFRLKDYLKRKYIVHSIFDKSKNLIHDSPRYSQSAISNAGGVIATAKPESNKNDWSEVMIVSGLDREVYVDKPLYFYELDNMKCFKYTNNSMLTSKYMKINNTQFVSTHGDIHDVGSDEYLSCFSNKPYSCDDIEVISFEEFKKK